MWIWCDRKRERRLVKAFQGERLVIKSDNNKVLGFGEKVMRTSPWAGSVLANRVWTGPVESSQMAGESTHKVKRVCWRWGCVERRLTLRRRRQAGRKRLSHCIKLDTGHVADACKGGKKGWLCKPTRTQNQYFMKSFLWFILKIGAIISCYLNCTQKGSVNIICL